MTRFTALGILLGFAIFITQSSCREPSPEEVEAKIAASRKLRQIDEVCSELPKPQSFRQIKKGISGNSRLSIIYYQYASDEPFSQVRDFYKANASEAGFVVTGEDYREPEALFSNIKLSREGVAIVVEHRRRFYIYNIDCIK